MVRVSSLRFSDTARLDELFDHTGILITPNCVRVRPKGDMRGGLLMVSLPASYYDHFTSVRRHGVVQIGRQLAADCDRQCEVSQR